MRQFGLFECNLGSKSPFPQARQAKDEEEVKFFVSQMQENIKKVRRRINSVYLVTAGGI